MGQTIVVVPCYNEAHRLPVDTFQSFASRVRTVRFLFVDDGSTDATLQVLLSLRESDSEAFDILSLEENAGKAEAVRQGILNALKSGPDYVGFWDADLATPLDAILEFCDLLESRPNIEMVFGARVQLLGRTIRRNLLRHYLGRIFATVASILLGVSVYDTQCGAKLFRVNPCLYALLREPFITRWIFDVEIIARLIQADATKSRARDVIYESPLSEWRDVKGSKITPGDFFRAAFEMIAIYRRYL